MGGRLDQLTKDKMMESSQNRKMGVCLKIVIFSTCVRNRVPYTNWKKDIPNSLQTLLNHFFNVSGNT
ncbi:MAG: hypothetical protein ACOC5D_07390 [Thermoplasmatota archaeon]